MLADRIFQEGITFDDVLMMPAYSEVLPREVSLKGRFSRNVSLDIPFASAAMDTVTEADMAIAMAKAGGIGVIHKNMSAEAQAAQVARVKGEGAVVLDSAHGHSKGVIDALKSIKDSFPGLDVVVGNIATADAARDLIASGADGLKVGIGPGSICTTRIVAGVGVPQLTAIAEVASVAGEDIPVIADGGLRYSGDVVKALAAGAHCVMCGSMFAGTDEAPVEIVEVDGIQMKGYRGMGSIDAMQAGSADRYFQKGAQKLVPEGVVARVAYKGPVADVLYQLTGGLRSGMGYCGAADLTALHHARFIKISPATVRENHPHDVAIAKKSPNYQ